MEKVIVRAAGALAFVCGAVWSYDHPLSLAALLLVALLGWCALIPVDQLAPADGDRVVAGRWILALRPGLLFPRAVEVFRTSAASKAVAGLLALCLAVGLGRAIAPDQFEALSVPASTQPGPPVPPGLIATRPRAPEPRPLSDFMPPAAAPSRPAEAGPVAVGGQSLDGADVPAAVPAPVVAPKPTVPATFGVLGRPPMDPAAPVAVVAPSSSSSGKPSVGGLSLDGASLPSSSPSRAK